MSSLSYRDRYFEAIGIKMDDDPKREDKLKAVLDRAHDIRKFEIELYWKRAAYFWAFQLVAFTILGFLLKDGKFDNEFLRIPATIGAVTALAGYLTAKGSKFWQENWEAHVDMLEGETEGRLTQVIVCRSSPQFSVSRTNQFLLSLLTLAWLLVLLYAAIPQADEFIKTVPPLCRGITIFGLVGLACYLMYIGSKTRLTGRIFRSEDTDWTKYPSKRKNPAHFIIWRDPLGGKEAE